MKGTLYKRRLLATTESPIDVLPLQYNIIRNICSLPIIGVDYDAQVQFYADTLYDTNHVIYFAFRVFQGHWGLRQCEVVTLEFFHSRTD